MKTKKFKSIYAMFIFVMVMVLVGCSKYDGPSDGPEKPEPPTPDPTTLEKVEKINCTTISSTWDGENVTLKTRASYDAMYRDGAFWAVSKVDYLAKLTYSDGKVVNKTKSYSVTNNANAFWGKKIGYIKDINHLKNTAPSFEVRPIEEGQLNFISWKGIWDVAIVVKNTKSVNSLDFDGKSVNDLCAPEMTITYKNVVITDMHKDSLNFHLYEVAVVVDAKIGEGDNDYREVTLGTKKFWQPKNGGDIPGTDPEIVLYQLRNQGFEYKTPLTSRSYATLVAIYTDGTEKEVQKIETTVNNYSKAQGKQEFVVPNFDYFESEPKTYRMVGDGTERVSTENTNISLKGYQTSYYMSTNYFSCLYEGHFEIPYYTDLLGVKHTMLYKEYDMADMGIVRGSVKTEGAYQILPLTSKVNATFNERADELSAEVDLKKPNGAIEENLTGISVINVRVIDEYIHYDLVRYFPSGNTTTAMKVLHGAVQTAEERKNTKERNYDPTSSKTDTLSKTAFTDGKHTGRLVKFTKTYHYNDFDNIITNEVRMDIVYSEGGFSALIFAGNPSCDKVGSVLGTEDLGNEKQNIYDDVINYQLNIGSVKAAASTQVVRYTYDIPVPEKKLVSVEEHKLIDENTHVIKITYDDNTIEYDTVKVEKPVTLVGGVINDLNRDNLSFGKGNVDHNQTPASGTNSTSGRVTATPYTHTYPVAYNNHSHNVTGTYNKYKYTFAYKSVEKSCNLTSPTLNVENTNINLGTTRRDTVNLKVYENTPVTFVYNGKYGKQTVPATVKTNNVKYIGDVVVPEKKLVSVEEHKLIDENTHVIKITYDDGTFEYDTVKVEKPVTLVGGIVGDLNRDNLNFGKGNVDHNQTPASGSISTSGRVTATSYTHTYPVAYNNHNHNVKGTYNKYKYTFAYKGVEKSCNLTSPSLNVENTSVNLGTTRRDTVNLKVYETTPVTFVYNGKYGKQTAPATVKTNNIKYIGDVVVKTNYVFAGMARVLNPAENGFYNGVILKVSGEKNGYRVIIPQIGYDKFYDQSTVNNSGKIEAAVWNGIDYLPCEVLVDNNAQIFAYDAKNTAGNKKLPMSFAEALIAGIKNYSGNINVTVTPIIAGATAVKSNGKTIVSLGGAVVLIIDDEIETSRR